MTRRTDWIGRMPDWHRITVTHVADGDTVRVHAYLGLGIEMTGEYVRLLGIQAPELQGDDRWRAEEARRTLSKLTLNRECLVNIPGGDRDRYGRWLGYLYRVEPRSLVCMNTWMVQAGLATNWAPARHRHGRWLPPCETRITTLAINDPDQTSSTDDHSDAS